MLSIRRRRQSARAPATRRRESGELAREPTPARAVAHQAVAPKEEPEHELVEAWVQFLRDHVTRAVNDLNNRLNAIVGLAQELEDQNFNDAQREGVSRMQGEVRGATEITGSLLNRVTSEAPEVAPPAWNLLRDRPARPGRILVVEDDESNRTVMTRLFRKLGHQVIAVSSGYEAFEVIQDGQLDCIISDLRMPTLGGKTLFEQVENRKPDMASRFVFVTGDYTRPESYEFLQQSGRPVVGKPYEIDQLLAAVATVFGEMGVIIDHSSQPDAAGGPAS